MLEETKTCPYTGLRPFSEEESLYFKGRDEHIDQATRQLGKNKFLILTGASGDGKSSLVYAGIVPNARAGFLKSTFSNWVVADFRPERNPFYNLCKSVATQFGIANVETVKSELSHGFSALTDLYKASALYYDEHDQAWMESDEKGKNVLRRKAANLLILADQFEEFFTNPENYQKGVPSSEAALVANLLLETARIALEENLPIYVVITMRSDFIGQCAAFRGLPEYIGFSQFFVPRLNRRQLQEVIEEPARFNGDRISRRLTERLIHDMVEGTDQLPILQHALNQIWKMAGDGEEEMDLIHYAMVGGMEGSALPAEDAEKFSRWFSELPEKIRNCYDSPDLQNVLNTHSNKLFYQASDFIKAKGLTTIDEDGTRLVIETAFKCLTKIDNGRAVRNRMTLVEISAIIGKPNVDISTLQTVLDIFREPGNTLLKPYITEDPQTVDLKEDAVLDITHESLIRNWEHLGEWAAQEFKDFSIFLDFEQQLNRWIDSGKSNSFLLYIGPLTYFENWFVKARPNASWIARYLGEDIPAEVKLTKAERILNDSQQFLRRSARKHVVTRTVMRYGPRRIAAVLGLVAIVVLSSFSVKSYLERRNAYVLNEIKAETFQVAGNPKVSLTNRVPAVIGELELGQVTVREIIAKIPDRIEQINLSTGVASELTLVTQTADVPHQEITDCLTISDSLLDLYTVPPVGMVPLERLLEEIDNFQALLEQRYYNSRDPQIDQWRIKNSRRAGQLAWYILTRQPPGFSKTTELNVALENGLNSGSLSADEVKELVNVMSPFANSGRSEWMKKTYESSKLEGRGLNDIYGPKFNGLFRELSYLYAASGEEDLALKCIDSLLFYNQNYHQNNYSNIPDNASNTAVYFYTYKHTDKLKLFVTGYCKRKNMSEEEFFDRLLARCRVTFVTVVSLESSLRDRVFHNTNLEYGSDDQLRFFLDSYREVVARTVSNPDARNLDLAVSYKNEGLLLAKRNHDAGLKVDSVLLYGLFDKSVSYFKQVSNLYRDEPIQFVDNVYARKTLFTFPDIVSTFHPWEPRNFYTYFSSEAFVKYILDRGLFAEFAATEDELKNFSTWIAAYNLHRSFSWLPGYQPLDVPTLNKLESKLLANPGARSMDFNMLYIHLTQQAMDAGNPDKAQIEFNRIQPKNLTPYIESLLIPQSPFGQVGSVLGTMFSTGSKAKAYEIIKSFPSAANRAILYGYSAKALAMKNKADPMTSVLLDSCRREIERDEDHENNPRVMLAYALAMRGGPADFDEANKVMKNAGSKPPGFARMCRSMSYRGNLFEARNFIPDNSSDEDRAVYLAEILYGQTLAHPLESPFWKKYEAGRWVHRSEFLFPVN